MGFADDFDAKPVILIRADANQRIGSGHVMRCSAIAQELCLMGAEALFAVSDDESSDFVRGAGFAARVVPGDSAAFGRKDADRLTALAEEVGAAGILVDSYAATDEFFEGLGAVRKRGGLVAYIDDLYTFETGYSASPRPRAVDVVVNYSFSASEPSFRDAYRDIPVALLIGPSFAPIRSQFKRKAATHCSGVEKILITSGSTNQGLLLENLVNACLTSAPHTKLDVVVGKLATYEGVLSERVSILRDVKDMAFLMEGADLALSAAGSTLYELAAVGVPTIAIVTTENQSLNAEGFARLDLGPVVRFEDGCFIGGDLEATVSDFVQDADARVMASELGARIVDGKGAERIATALLRY